MHAVFKISLKHVALAAYVLMMLPTVFFFLGWLAPWWGIPATAILVAGFVWLYRADFLEDRRSVDVPVVHLVGVVVLCSLVVAISGIADIGVSGFDIPWRNAIFHDLMDYDWPVVYSDGNAMVYYCAFWLPAAAVGKVLGWGAGFAALWTNVVAIMMVSYLLILCLLSIESPKRMWMAAFFLVFWSGLQFLAAALISSWGWNLYNYPLLTDGSGYLDAQFNGESFNWYYRSNFMTLQMTYNQLLIWLAVPLALAKRKARDYLFLGLLVLPCSPWGFIGLIPLLVVAAVSDLRASSAKGGIKAVVRSVFSPANVAALLTVLPVFALYFMASSKTGGTTSSTLVTSDQVSAAVAAGIPYTTQTGSFGFLSFDRFDIYNVASLVFFYLIEFGIYMLLVRRKYRHEPLFPCILIVLMIVPLMWAGTINGRDFCMNASIPSLFMLMVFVLAYMNDDVCGKPFGMRSACLVLALAIAFTGPVFSILGRVASMREANSIAVIDDSIGTLSDKSVDVFGNFLIEDPQSKPFYKYLAR